MDDQQRLTQLIQQAQALQSYLEVEYLKSDDTVRWFIRNSLDYIEGVLNELRAAYMYVAGREE